MQRGKRDLFVFALWALMATLPLAYAMIPHTAALPLPAWLPTLQKSQAGWRMVHVLSADCGCSQEVARQLEQMKKASGLEEHILWIGSSNEVSQRLKDAGYPLDTKTAEEVGSEFGLEGVPWLFIFDAGGKAVYSGGHSPGLVRNCVYRTSTQVG